VIVDGNMESDPAEKIFNYLQQGHSIILALTCMPGPQLKQAIPISKKIREQFPPIKIIWGGYFPSNQSTVVLNSGYVDFVVNGPGEKCFPDLLRALENDQPHEQINSLIYKKGDEIIRTKKMNYTTRMNCLPFLMKN
jgi:radical SAM superfamily enzyme YgiQ (UPF0313 family)